MSFGEWKFNGIYECSTKRWPLRIRLHSWKFTNRIANASKNPKLKNYFSEQKHVYIWSDAMDVDTLICFPFVFLFPFPFPFELVYLCVCARVFVNMGQSACSKTAYSEYVLYIDIWMWWLAISWWILFKPFHICTPCHNKLSLVVFFFSCSCVLEITQ